jgi:hypothetical protein
MSVKPEDEIVKITWHQNRPDQFQVMFEDGRQDIVHGHRSKAQALAEDLGFGLVTGEAQVAEWLRES